MSDSRIVIGWDKTTIGRPTTARDQVCAVVQMLGRTTAARVAEELDWDHFRASHALRRAVVAGVLKRFPEKCATGRYYVYEAL